MAAERNSLIKGLRWLARTTSQRWISPITDHYGYKKVWPLI